MNELTPKDIKKLERLAAVIDKGNIGVFEHLVELEDKVDELLPEVEMKLEKAIEEVKASVPDMKDVLEQIKGYTPVKGKDYFDGEPGDDGEDYILTEQDKKDIAKKIEVPVVEKVIERTKTEVVREQPMITEVVKEVAVFDEAMAEATIPKLGEAIRNALELLQGDERLDASAIKGLDEIEKRLRKSIDSIPRGGGGRSNNSTKFFPLTADGTTKVFLVPKSVASIVLCSDFPTVLMEGKGFTLNATRTQLTLTVENAPSAGSQLLYQYSSMFN